MLGSIPPVTQESGKRKCVLRGWQVYALVLTGLVALSLAFPWASCMERGRKDGWYAVDQALKLAGKRDFDSMAAIATPEVIEFMRERDRKWGKVLSYSFEDSYVQISGTPANFEYRVWRQQKNVREGFTASGRQVTRAWVVWPEAEEK